MKTFPDDDEDDEGDLNNFLREVVEAGSTKNAACRPGGLSEAAAQQAHKQVVDWMIQEGFEEASSS